MPKVSVIIPIYNVEKYVKQCLDSIINQTLTDIEIICINDGSSDNSINILNEYAQKDERIKIISQVNQGQGVARNNGIKVATGEYIGFVDPDDFIDLSMYEKMYKVAKSNDVDLIECTYRQYYEKSKEIVVRQNPIELPKDETFDWRISPDYVFRGTILSVWNKLFKASFVRENNIAFSQTKLAEDHIFTIKSRILAKKISFLDNPLYTYRVSENSSVNSINQESINIFPVLEEVRSFLKGQDIFLSFEKQVQNYFSLTLARIYKLVPEQIRDLYDERCRDFCDTESMYKRYQNYKFGQFTFIERIFSLKNETRLSIKYKVLVILGIKIKLKPVIKEIAV